MKLTLDRTDNDNCRVYYRDEKRRLLCFQDTFRGQFELLKCSRDGEPEYPVTHARINLADVPEQENSTAIAFVTWRASMPEVV